MLTSVCGGSNRVHFEGSGSLKGHLCIFGSLSRAQGPFFTTGLLFGIFMCTFSKVIWVLWGSTKLSFKIEWVTFSNLRRRNWADNQPASEQQLLGWSDLDLAELYIIFNEHVNNRGRRPPPFFAILQASKGAERRSEYLAGEARGVGGDKGVSRPF